MSARTTTLRHALWSAALAAMTMAAPAAAQDQPPRLDIPSIVTTGQAVIRRVPDEAFISVAVETRARAPRDAQRQNADLMTAVQQKVVDAGIMKEAIRTTGYSINEDYEYANGRRTLRGYIARNGLEIRLDAIERTGDILDIVVQAGATNVNGVRFDIKDRVAVERDALRHAVEDARARADALAAGAGKTVDRVLRIDDTRQPRFYAPPSAPMMRAAAQADAAPTPIAPGLIEISADVTLTVSIK